MMVLGVRALVSTSFMGLFIIFTLAMIRIAVSLTYYQQWGPSSEAHIYLDMPRELRRVT